MSTENRFNLIDEPWIPIVNVGRVSLRQVFSNANYRALGGNPVQKIALTKLLLAIAQAAYTPQDDEDWEKLGAEGMAKKCLEYLEKWYDRFWLYGEKPFLQMPAIGAAKMQNYGAVLPEVATGNTTIVTENQVEKELSDAEKALLVVTLMGFGLGGKKTDNSIVLSAGYTKKIKENGKPGTGKPGTSIGFMGFLHSFLLGESLLKTIWFNLFTAEQVSNFCVFASGVGIAPWENMPIGEDCEIAKTLKKSLMGKLIPVSRCILLHTQGLHYSEGILHDGYNEGSIDPSVAVNFSGKKPKALWVNFEQRPWRFLTALLSFITNNNQSIGFDCYQIRFGLSRARVQNQCIGIWSGGLRVSSNAGEQYVSGRDDFVESAIMLPEKQLGKTWFIQLEIEMKELEQLSKTVYGTVLQYFKYQNSGDGKNLASQAANLYWQLCERKFQDLVNACADYQQAKKMRKIFARFANQAYDTFCPKETARQLDAWAKHKPNFSKYLSQ